jgi:hypothetical protein
MLANLTSGMQGSADELAAAARADIITVFADPKIQGLIGEWNLVWGPEVVVGPLDLELKHKAINTMFIGYQAATDTYIVAIAGTNASSLYDWFVEDFWVNEQVVWPYIANSEDCKPPKVSAATHYGLNQLIGMADDAAAAREYLRDHITEGTKVMVTGHSLGGALSPSYALYLNDTAKEWNPDGHATLSTLATAGATPGNSAFVEYFTQKIGETFQRVWNGIDVVPHAWERDLLEKIPKLYAPTIEPDLVLDALVGVALFLSRNGDYIQLNDATGFDSTVQAETGGTIIEFLKELAYQHIQGYYNHFEILEFQQIVKELIHKEAAESLMDRDFDAVAKKLVEHIIVKAVEHEIPDIDVEAIKAVLSKL